MSQVFELFADERKVRPPEVWLNRNMEIPRNRICFMVSTREHPEMGLIPVSPSGLESAYLECVADPSVSRPNGAMPTSEGCEESKGTPT